jgi:hypothetical protein
MTLGASWISSTDRSKGFQLFANTLTDAENNVDYVDYYVNGAFAGRSSTPSKYAFNYTSVAWDVNYAVKATVYDKAGASGVSNSFSIQNPFAYNLSFSGLATWYYGLYVNYALPAGFTSGTMELLNPLGNRISTQNVAAGSSQVRFTGVYMQPAGNYRVRLVVNNIERAAATVSKTAY